MKSFQKINSERKPSCPNLENKNKEQSLKFCGARPLQAISDFRSNVRHDLLQSEYFIKCDHLRHKNPL